MQAHTPPPPPRNAIPEGVVNLADHEAHAQGLLSAATWAYLNGGAADETTLRANAQAWQQLPLQPRVLRNTAGGHTRLTLLGRELRHPILVAPMAYQQLAHPHGEIATALAANAQEAGLVLSTQSSTPLEEVARVARHGAGATAPLWFQLYWQGDRGFTCALLERAEAAGYEALVLTVDAPVQGVRDQERRTGFKLPPGVSAVHLNNMQTPPAATLQAGQSRLFDELLCHAPTWNDVAWLLTQTRLPVLLKGILHPDDARQAIGLGAAALIVSNHGGRTLDTVAPTAHLLPAIAQAVAGTVPVLVDGGIRRGTDVLKALALGASAVLHGRPVLHGLATGGAAGVAHVIRLLRDELEVAMALCGCQTLADIRAELIWQHHL
ncbi:alpha-hydroxy-acid oxidizing protein [Hydrogenophaga sp.]|uniref:alpha-hydroxy acid oxidase n=1 Tax=Hydrogenophaga sp. TaxID=1904254 RepID=UPI0035695502